MSGVGIRQYAQRSMLAYTVCSSDPRGAKGIGGDAAGCSDDLVHGHGQSHVGAGGGFHGVAHFVLHVAMLACPSIRLTSTMLQPFL